MLEAAGLRRVLGEGDILSVLLPTEGEVETSGLGEELGSVD